MTASDTIEPGIWRTAKCFIVCGGPSVADHDLARLNGHRVIVVNSSFQTVPQADYLVFADKRWWRSGVKLWFMISEEGSWLSRQ